MSQFLSIANLRHAASMIWTCTKPEFELFWMKLCSSDNQCTYNIKSFLWRKAADIQDEKKSVNLWIFMKKIRHNLWHNFSINCEITFLWNTERNLALLFILQIYLVTVKPVYSWHLRFLKKVSAITRCSLYRVLEILGKKRSQELRWMIFSYDMIKQCK